MSFTLGQPNRLQVEIRRSVFIGHALPLASEDEVEAGLLQVSDAAATHNCWAWRYGERYRSSDDGEPASTAGRPILAAIDGQQMDRVLVVVTRHYGGIKLGAGGLVRAYGGCAAECLRSAERVELVRLAEVELDCDFELLGVVYQLMEQSGATRTNETFSAGGARLTLSLPEAAVERFGVDLRNASRGKALLRKPPDPG